MALDDLYREVILEHYKNPHHKGNLPDATLKVEAANPLCGDEMALDLKLEGTVVQDIRWQGMGCSISLASASMMCDLVKGKDVAEASRLAEDFKKMMRGESDGESLGEAVALQGVSKFPVRVKCAELAWACLEDGFKQAGLKA